jgi:hypothetical protein
MKYPKEVMKRNELIKMGFTKGFLNEVAKISGVAFKTSDKKNSPYYYNTTELEKVRKAVF